MEKVSSGRFRRKICPKKTPNAILPIKGSTVVLPSKFIFVTTKSPKYEQVTA